MYILIYLLNMFQYCAILIIRFVMLDVYIYIFIYLFIYTLSCYFMLYYEFGVNDFLTTVSQPPQCLKAQVPPGALPGQVIQIAAPVAPVVVGAPMGAWETEAIFQKLWKLLNSVSKDFQLDVANEFGYVGYIYCVYYIIAYKKICIDLYMCIIDIYTLYNLIMCMPVCILSCYNLREEISFDSYNIFPPKKVDAGFGCRNPAPTLLVIYSITQCNLYVYVVHIVEWKNDHSI